MTRIVSLCNAETHLSALVEPAAAGAEIVIARNGATQARLAPAGLRGKSGKPANAMQLTRIADDFAAPDAAVVRLSEGSQ